MNQGSLRYFITKGFAETNPGVVFAYNWHIGVITDYLERVTRGEIKRLIINVPPRSLKSFCVSVAWPAWLLGLKPSRRIIAASYSQQLSEKHSLDCRHLINSAWYRSIFANTVIAGDQNQKNKFITSARGFRFASSIGGTITGEGGNFLIVDDPHNALSIHSKTKRQSTIKWFQQSFTSRLDNKKEGVIVIVMQRLHPEDLTGFLLKNQIGIWQHLCIPAIADTDRSYTEGSLTHYFKENEILHRDREGIEEIERTKLELGSFAFAAQYLQQPVISGGGMIKQAWLRYFDSAPRMQNIIISWDTAIKSGDDTSYSVGTCWGEVDNQFYLLEVIRKRLEYPELKRQITSLATKWQPLVTIIEDKASGQTLLQDLQREGGIMVSGIKVSLDKVTRFAAITPLFESGNVHLSKNASWLEDYENEILTFPYGEHDDQVDSTSQYFNYMLRYRARQPKLRRLY